MKYKKTIILLALVVFLLSIAGVSASEIDNTIASENANTIELSADNDIIEDNLQTSEENEALASTDYDEAIAQTDTEVLGADSATYSDLAAEISQPGNITLTHKKYTYDEDAKAITISEDNKVIDGNGAVIDMTCSGFRALDVIGNGVTIKNLTIINAIFLEKGGAIKFAGYFGAVINCNFINNTAQNGGAIYFDHTANVENCNFIDNHAKEWGGAVFLYNGGSVTKCNFTNNTAANYGGAIRILSGNVANCSFTGNTATNADGGAIIMESGTVKNCNFVNNTAANYGGAVYFNENCEVTNCNFTDNIAKNNGGGAVFFSYTGTVENCNFINNTASRYSGAIHFSSTGDVVNCNFADNKATGNAGYGGAIYFYGGGTVTNCNFVNNTATVYGGAIRFRGASTLLNCNFTGNNATYGSAIYFNSASAYKIVSNSLFLNNKANAEELQITKNENNITITFTGNDNLLNAIYSAGDISFTNVTYWGENGVTNTGSSAIKPIRSNRLAGQNITVGVVINGKIVLNQVNVTNNEGMIVLNISAGENYYIGARHDTDSYYAEIQNMATDMKFYANVTSQTTHNKTVNITAKSNIPQDVVQGKLLFIVPNTDPINATYAGNGTWWAVYTFDNAGDYNVNASYIGLDNVTINNATISIRFDASVEVNNKTLDLLIGDTFTVVATTTPEGLKVSFVPDDSGVYSIDENGNVIALRDGEGSILIKVGDDGIYAKNSTIVNVTVSKVPTEITANDVTTTYNSNKDLVITLKDSTGKALSGVKVTVDLNGAKTYTTDSNGQVKVPTKGLAPKTYTAKITFNGNTNYEKSAKNVKVTVKKATPKLTAKKKTYKTTTKTKKYTIVLKDNVGKAIKKAKVTLKVKGKTYKAKTNSKGKATFKIKNLKKKGTFKAVIKYKGNKYYKKLTKNAKIKVIVKFKTVSRGSKDSGAVKEIQQALKDNGYYLTYDGHYLKVDGKFNSCTLRSVKEFQHDKGLKVTGKVDEKTAKKLGLI